MSTIGKRIREFRNNRGLSQVDLGKMVGVGKITVLRWENGTSKPSHLAAEKLSAIGLGALLPSDTKETSTPRVLLKKANGDSLRDAVRKHIRVGQQKVQFDPAPYVINGPADQLGFFENMYKLQESPTPPLPTAEYLRRLSLVTSAQSGSVPTMQSDLESPKPTAMSWNPNYGPHGWHRYVGRFPPHLVRALINGFGARPGDTLLDPFCGSGTALLEARLLGLSSIGIDLCPLSCLISRTKVQFPKDTPQLADLPERLADHYSSRHQPYLSRGRKQQLTHNAVLQRAGNSIKPFPNVEKWFIPEALLGVSIVVEFAMGLKGYARDFVCCALSSCMRSIGNVDVDVVRAEYRREPRANVDVLKLVVRAMRRMQLDIDRAVASHRGVLSKPKDHRVVRASMLKCDIPARSVDFIITSPPYGVESLSYLRTHLLSYRSLAPIFNYDPYHSDNAFVGSEYLGDPKRAKELPHLPSKTYQDFFAKFDRQPAPNNLLRRILMMKRFFLDMHRVGNRFAHWLKVGGKLAFVIGNKRLGDKIIPTDRIVGEIFSESRFHLDRIIRHKLKCNNSNSEVPWQERTIQEEFVMIFSRGKK